MLVVGEEDEEVDDSVELPMLIVGEDEEEEEVEVEENLLPPNIGDDDSLHTEREVPEAPPVPLPSSASEAHLSSVAA